MGKFFKIGSLASNAAKILLLLIFIGPFLWMVSTSLQTFEETLKVPPTIVPETFQWVNFLDALKSGPFGTYFKNSVTITFSIMLIQLIIMVPAAYAFAKYDFLGKKFLFGCVLIAFMIPGQVTFIPIYLMMSDWDLVYTLWPQILPFMTNAFGIFLLRQYIMQIPDELLHAARLDNSSEWQIILKIVVPMAKPALATIMLFSFVSHWNDYFWPLIMTNTAELRPLTLGISMLREVEGIANWHIIMAGNVILVVPILIVYIFSAKYILRAFAYSGIK